MRYYIARIRGGDYFCLASRAAMRSSSSCMALIMSGRSLHGAASYRLSSSLLMTRSLSQGSTGLASNTALSSWAMNPVSLSPTLPPSRMFQVNCTGRTCRRKSMPELRVITSHLSRASLKAVIVVTWARMIPMELLPRVIELQQPAARAVAPLPSIKLLQPVVVVIPAQ